MNHDELLAHSEISRTLADCARHADENRPDAQVRHFTEDCRVVYSPGHPLNGRTELLGALRATLAKYRATSHLLGQPVITLTGPTMATAVTTVQAWHRRASDGTDMVLHGRYADQLVLVGTRWLIATRELQIAGAAGREESDLSPLPRASVADEQVIVAGWIDWDPAHRDLALKCFHHAAEPTLAEPGCLDYTMTADATNPERIRVFERWVDDDSLELHLTTAHIAAFREQTASLTKLGRSLNRFRVHDVRPMGSRR